MYEESSNYLKHYGVLGMRWGRRALRKEVRKEYERTYDTEYKIANKRSADLESKMLKYADKHKLAYDDGGGGTDKQRKTYEKMSQELWNLEDKAYTQSKAAAAKKIIDKYGEKEYRHIQTVDTIKTHGAVALMLGVPVVALGALSALLIKG